MIEIWTRLWPEIKVHKKLLVWVIIFGFITNGFKAIVPKAFGMLTEVWQKADPSQKDLIWQIPIAVAGAWILSSIARFYHVYWMKYISDLVSVSMRRRLMDKYLSLDMSFYQNFERGSGGLISRMLNDVQTVLNGVTKMADVLREPIMVFAMVGYLLYLEFKLTLFIFIALPIVTTVLRRLARSLRKYSKINQEIMEDLTRTLKETLDGSKVVQSFCLEGELHDKFNVQADKFIATRKKIIAREEAAGPLSESITSLFLAAVLVFVGSQMIKSQMNISEFMSYLLSMVMLQDGIRKLQDGYIKMQQASIAMTRMEEILYADTKIPEPTSPKPFPENWQEIEFKNVSFGFNNETILKNLSLTVRRNEVIALVGSSGSGKTTMVNLLQRFFDPQNGTISIGGTSVKDMTLHELRSHIALVTQDVFLFNDTIEKNILYGNPSKTLPDIQQAAKLANAHNFISSTPKGYSTSVGDFGSRMSGGEKQRISIARAILKDAPILVLDEATSALDSESELEVQKGLEHLLQGRTAFVIAHRLSTIAHADRIIVIKKGEIVEQGTHAQLLNNKGEYFKFHQMQHHPEIS